MQFYLSTFYLFLAVLGLHCFTGFSLVVESGGCSLLQGLLLWRTGSRVGRLSRWGFQALEHRLPGLVAVAHRLGCSMVCGSSRIRDQASVSCISRWILITEPPGKPHSFLSSWFTCCSRSTTALFLAAGLSKRHTHKHTHTTLSLFPGKKSISFA